MTVTRRRVASALVTLLFLGCAAGPKPADPAPDASGAPTRGRAASERPADPVVYLHLVRAHYHAEAAEWPQAVAELRKALDRDPRAPALWHLLARWLGRQGAHAEAIAAAKQALALDPQRSAVYLTLAETYHAQKNDAEATAALEQAIRLTPQTVERLRDAGALRGRAQGLHDGGLLPPAAPPGPAPARPRALPARPAGGRARSLGRRDPSSPAGGRDRPRPGRGVGRARLRVRAAEEAGRGGACLPGRDRGEPGESGAPRPAG